MAREALRDDEGDDCHDLTPETARENLANAARALDEVTAMVGGALQIRENFLANIDALSRPCPTCGNTKLNELGARDCGHPA